MNIVFFLTSRYPTHKAYGVTTGETARELANRGNKVNIIAPNFTGDMSQKDPYDNQVILIQSKFVTLARKHLYDLRIIGRPIFVMTSMLFTLKTLRILRRNSTDVVWLRDFWSGILIKFFAPTIKLVVEVHQRPSGFGMLNLYLLQKHENTALLTIQESLKIDLQRKFPAAKVYLGFMGARSEFFETGRFRFQQLGNQADTRVKVCYLGRFSSSGIDNGLYELLENWRRIPEDLAELTLIGLSESEIKTVRKQFEMNNLRTSPSLPHSVIPKTLANFDCGLVPYPEGAYHRTRFPIKIVEYGACGLNIIASDTVAHRELLKEDFAYFYSLTDASSLLHILEEIMSNRRDSRERARRSFVWAQDYTYSKRVSEIYPFLEGK